MSQSNNQPNQRTAIGRDSTNSSSNSSSSNSSSNSSSSNSNSNNDSINLNELYIPHILHLKCVGTFSHPPSLKQQQELHQRKKQHQIQNFHSSNLPVCEGIHKMTPLRSYPPMKPNDALRIFEHSANVINNNRSDNDNNHGFGFGGNGNYEYGHGYNRKNNGNSSDRLLSGKDKRRRRMDTVVAPNPSRNQNNDNVILEKELPFIIDSKWDELKQELNERSGKKANNNNKNRKSINHRNSNNSQMKYIGSTDIYVLLLTPYKFHHYKRYQYQRMISNNSRRGIYNMSSSRSPFQLPLNPFPDQRTPLQHGQTKRNGNDENSNSNDDKNDKVSNGDTTKQQQTIPTQSSSSKNFFYAVAPMNRIGITKLVAKDDTGSKSLTSSTIKLGIMEIQTITFDDTNDISTDSVDNRFKDKKEGSDSKENRSDDDILTSIQKNINQGKVYYNKIEKASEKVQNSMMQNAKSIKYELFENDFLNRTKIASEKIIGNFDKTWKRMEKGLVDLWSFLNDDENSGDRRR